MKTEEEMLIQKIVKKSKRIGKSGLKFLGLLTLKQLEKLYEEISLR